MNKLIDLSDTTFLLIVRLDSIERLENIILVTEYIASFFETSTLVLESSPYSNGLLEKLLNKNIRYTFQEDHDPILFRTKCLNRMSSTVETPFIAVWDTDIIAPVIQVRRAVELLRTGGADFVYQYEKLFLDTSPILRKLYMQEPSIEFLEQNINKMKEMYTPNPVGGAFLANIKSYKESGLENENFYGWGLEDGERYYRWENLGYKIQRITGPLFHLSHKRGVNSLFQNIDQQLFKKKEILRIARNKIIS
jgi:hypothetical protein